eukprot:6172204-Pyramimonas_sp.AAC.1
MHRSTIHSCTDWMCTRMGLGVHSTQSMEAPRRGPLWCVASLRTTAVGSRGTWQGLHPAFRRSMLVLLVLLSFMLLY